MKIGDFVASEVVPDKTTMSTSLDAILFKLEAVLDLKSRLALDIDVLRHLGLGDLP